MSAYVAPMPTNAHPLDHVVRESLSGRQAAFALERDGVLRFAPRYGVFAALPDQSEGSLAALAGLVREHGDVAMVGDVLPQVMPGLAVVSEALCVQMTADVLKPLSPPSFDILALGDADAPEMLALATLTEPGPFFEDTHRLGRFVGVREKGVLVAMAGERMAPTGFREVSAVCTHPDHRGRGLAAELMLRVAHRIADEGDRPFLHSYAHNSGAIRLYEALGFRLRREIVLTRLTAA